MPCHNAAEDVPAKLVRAQGMGRGEELQLVLGVHNVGVIGHVEEAHHHDEHHQSHHAAAKDKVLVPQAFFQYLTYTHRLVPPFTSTGCGGR